MSYASEELTIVWLLLITVVIATYFIQSYKIKLLPPSSSAILLGTFFGGISRLAGLSSTLRFSPAAFFYALLPPIVFNAGFTLRRKGFFENLGTILAFAILGTFVSAIVFGLGTYFLVLLGIVRRSHLGGAPFVECLMYGAAISSIDPVATLAVLAQTNAPPVLYNIVFGESVLNDAVAIVLFRSLSAVSSSTSVGIFSLPGVFFRFVVLAIGSLAIGVGVALISAFLLKRFDAYYSSSSPSPMPLSAAASEYAPLLSTAPLAMGGGRVVREDASYDQQQQQPYVTAAGGIDSTGTGASTAGGKAPIDPTIYEIAIVVMSAYLAYLVAEVAGMSGIVALFFSGIIHAHYSHYNVSLDARCALRRLFEVFAFLSELFVFAYLGLQVTTMSHSFDFGLFFSGIPLAMASRAANVFPCSRLVNAYRSRKLPERLQRMLWAVGLRGAVAYGLIVNMPRADSPGDYGIPAIETAALLIVMASTLMLGSATEPLLKRLSLEGLSDEQVYAIGMDEMMVAADADAGGGMHGGASMHNGEGRGGGLIDMMGSGLQRSVVQEKFKEIDDMYLKPLFGGRVHDNGTDNNNNENNDTATMNPSSL